MSNISFIDKNKKDSVIEISLNNKNIKQPQNSFVIMTLDGTPIRRGTNILLNTARKMNQVKFLGRNVDFLAEEFTDGIARTLSPADEFNLKGFSIGSGGAPTDDLANPIEPNPADTNLKTPVAVVNQVPGVTYYNNGLIKGHVSNTAPLNPTIEIDYENFLYQEHTLRIEKSEYGTDYLNEVVLWAELNNTGVYMPYTKFVFASIPVSPNHEYAIKYGIYL